MSAIHQIYCTHCTHGSSALERREGSLAHRMLGYSARAGSMDVQDLRKSYRQIERYVYYYLPRDTPAEDKLRLTASTAPRRLIYLPSTSGLQLTGQVCYRQTDTEGRPGSYFAHVLFREEKDSQPRWSSLDCLKLWQAPGWVEEDSPDIAFRLQPLGSLAELLRGRRPAIDDGVLLSFLTTPANGSFDDPAGVIPWRWRQMEPGRRSALFAEAFCGFLELDAARRGSVLLIAEPSAAAVIFYGIVRLLPAGEIRETTGFSTFEPNTDRVSTALAATWFHDPQRSDVRPDAHRSRGLVLNTCVDRRAESRRPQSVYAQNILQCLLEGGWAQVDQRLRNLESLGVRRPEDLNSLAEVDRLVPVLLDPQLTLPNENWRRSAAATEYLRRALGRRLAELSDVESVLEPLLGRPAHLLILELIASEPGIPGARPAAEYLLKRLPGEKTAELLKLPGIPVESKVEALARYVEAHADLPPGCEGLWNERTPAGRPTPDGAPLLPRLLARLPANTLERFYQGGGERHAGAFLTALVEACRQYEAKRADVTRIVKAMDDQSLLSLLRSCGAGFFKDYPDEPALGGKLQEIVFSLPEHVSQFSDRLDLILAGRHLLPDDAAQDMVTAWSGCRQAMLELGRLQEQKSGLLRRPPSQEMEEAARRLAESAVRAMPRDRYDDDNRGAWRQDRLRRIGQRLLGKPLLPARVWLFEAVWQKIAWFFEMNRWPTAPLGKLHRKQWSVAKTSIVGAAAVVVVILLCLTLWPSGTQNRPAPTTASARQEDPGARLHQSPPSPPLPAPPLNSSAEKAPPPPQNTRPVVEERPPAKSKESKPEPKLPTEGPGPARKDPPQTASKPAAKGEDPFAELETPPAPKRPEVSERAQAEQRWQKEAREFAERHHGVFLTKVPLLNGRFEIPDAAFASPPEEGQWSLKEGRLYMDGGVFPFRAGPDEDPPVVRCEMPSLAERWELASVAVRLVYQSGKLYLAVDARSAVRAADTAADAKSERDRWFAVRQKLLAQLGRWRKTTDAEQRNVLRDDLFKLMGVKVPAVPGKPSRDDPKFKDMEKDPKKAEEFQKAVQAHDQGAAKKTDLQSRVEELAVARIRDLTGTIEDLDKEIKRARRETTDDHDRTVQEFKAKCQGLSVLILPVDDRRRDAPAASENPPAEPPKPVAMASGSGLPMIGGALKVLPDPDAKPDHSGRVRLKVQVLFDASPKPPKWLADRCLVSCIFRFHRRSGGEEKPVPDVSKSASVEVPSDTSQVDLRIDFLSREPDSRSGDLPRIATTEPLPVTASQLEGGTQHLVRFQISREGLEKLQEALSRRKAR